MEGGESSSPPSQLTALEGDDHEGSPQESPGKIPESAASSTGGAVGSAAVDEEGGHTGTEELVHATAHARGETADAAAQATSAGFQVEPPSSLATQSGVQELAEVDVMARAQHIDKDFEAMLGQRTYRQRRDTINFLADPNSRPVDPRFPELSAEQKQRILRAGRSVETWDVAPILANDQEKQACILANQRAKENARATLGDKSDEDWRSASSSEWIDLVPSMKRRLRQPIVRRGPRPGPPSQGTLGSAFVYFNKSSAASAATERNAKRLRLETRPGYEGDELTPMLRRLDEQDRGSVVSQPRRMTLDPSQRAAAPFPSTRALAVGSVSRTPQPRRAGGSRMSTGGSSFNRRGSSGTALRYRQRDFTPGRAPRASLAGVGERTHGAGMLGDWLGETSKQPEATGGNDRRSSTSNRESFGQRGGAPSKRRADGQDPHPDGPQIHTAPRSPAAAGNKRAASSLGLEGMDATPRRKMQAVKEVLTDEGKRLVRKVEAEAKATAEVGSILMSVVSQESKARDVTRQVREEQMVGTKKREDREEPSRKQVRR